MQYFKPESPYFVGDCMPFYHSGVFHLYYLWDENHHGAKSGLGGHQWAHASTTDLIHWTHHPMAIAITDDWEGSICTGSVFHHEGTYYAYYAVRLPDLRQQVYLAKSDDGIHFTKQSQKPLATPPPGYHANHYRDPVVFRDPDTGLYHMLITATLNDYPPHRSRRMSGPSGLRRSVHMANRRTVPHPRPPRRARMPRLLLLERLVLRGFQQPRGPPATECRATPWARGRRPEVDALDAGTSRVMKTAAFADNRRIGVSWVCTRVGQRR